MPRKKTDPEPSSSRDNGGSSRSTRKRIIPKNRYVEKEDEDEDEDEDADDPSPPPKKKCAKPKKSKKDVASNHKQDKPDHENENIDPNKEKPGLKRSFKNFVVGPVVRFYEHYQFGKINHKIKLCLKDSIISNIKSFKWYKAESCFDRRVTFIEWHPTDPKVLAVASKSGDIILWNYENPVDPTKMIKGSGAGGSIQV